MYNLRLLLLGPPRVELDGMPVEIERRKALALLVYLAASNQPRSRDTLATMFWPDHDQSRARAYLRRDLAVLNTGLGGDWLVADRETVELKRGPQLWVDMNHFRYLWSLSRDHPHTPGAACSTCLPVLKEAADLYVDDFLTGFTLRDSPEFDDWQFFEAESLRQDLALVLEALVTAYIAHKDFEAAIPYARRWVGLDSLHEPAQRQLIQLYDLAGQQAAALRQYQEYAQLLENEFGLQPEEETATLFEAIKAKRFLKPFIQAEERAGRLLPETPAGPAEAPGRPALAPVEIRLLGGFEVIRGERVLRATDWTQAGALALLQRLALERRLPQDQIIPFLWPGVEPAAANGQLTAVLDGLRQALDEALGPGTAGLTFAFEQGSLNLNEAVQTDVDRFEQLYLSLQATAGEVTVDVLQQALALYRGDLLPEALDSDWAAARRESLRLQHHEVVLALVTYHRTTRNYTAAITLLKSLLTSPCTNEALHREMMELYTLAGRRHDALRQYQLCADTLATELNRLPSLETETLYGQIASGEVAPLPADTPKPAWQLPAPIAAEVGQSPPLVGRASDLDTLQARIRTVWDRRGGTILLAGDAGVGKTRLAYEALRAAALSRMVTLVGAAYEQEGHLPYQPFVEAFDRYLAEQKRPPEQHPITYFKPEAGADIHRQHSALFKTTETFLKSLATRAPVVLMLDDLHAADEASLNLFHYLARQTRSAPIFLLATYRTDVAVDAVSAFGSLLNALYRERLSDVLHLTPLPETAVTELIGSILGGEIDPGLARTIFEMAEGNPFFVQEMSQAMLKEGQLYQDRNRWCLRAEATVSIPSELRELLWERVRRLGPGAEPVLTTAAVIGREFRFTILRQVSGLADRDLLDALDTALAAQLLQETEDGYRFRHSLIRQALYDGLSRARRAWLHCRTAETIEAVYAAHPSGLKPHMETLAYHYDRSDHRDRALPYLLQAGQKAADVYALEVANDYLERALELMDELGIEDQAQRWAILEQLGFIALILANTAQAVARYEQALALPTTETWQPSLNDRVRAHRWIARTLLTAGLDKASEEHLQAALLEVGDTKPEPEEYAYLLHDIALWHWHRNEYREAFQVAQRSLAIAEREQDREGIARAYEALALASHSLGEWQQGLSFEQQRSALTGSNQLDVTTAFDIHL